MSGLAPGEIVLEHASRAFAVRADRGRTVRELLLPRRGPGPQRVKALDDVNLHVRPGETLGIVGRNGAGKSSTLRVLAGIVPLDSGRAECGGRVAALLELGAGFGREFSGRENVYLNAALHGLTREQTDERIDAIVEFSELGEFVDAPVKVYSSGMLVRLGFAIAAHLDADVLLIDEVLAVGDEGFQRKCAQRIGERIEEGTTVVLVSHSASAIDRVCERVAVLDHGRLVFDGGTAEGLLCYHRLLGAENVPDASLRPASSRAVTVDEVELQDWEGRARKSFVAGDPLRVAMTIVPQPHVARARVEVEVRDITGRPLFGTGHVEDVGGRRSTLVFEIERLGLLGGDYDLVIGAGDGDAPGTQFDRIVALRVAPVAGAEGTADLRGSWSLAERVEAAR